MDNPTAGKLLRIDVGRACVQVSDRRSLFYRFFSIDGQSCSLQRLRLLFRDDSTKFRFLRYLSRLLQGSLPEQRAHSVDGFDPWRYFRGRDEYAYALVHVSKR